MGKCFFLKCMLIAYTDLAIPPVTLKLVIACFIDVAHLHGLRFTNLECF